MFVANVSFSQKGTLKIIVTDIKSHNGTINVALYNEEGKSGFLKNIETAYQKKIVKISDKKASIIFTNIPYGTYAISLFQDENTNMKLDRTNVGIPVEPWGVSGNTKGIAPPKFKDAKFDFKEKNKILTIKMRVFFRK